ncbi:Chloride channel protein ClC-Kb, partial [Tinamus guttatus]
LEEEEAVERVLVWEKSWRPCPGARRRLQGCLGFVRRQLLRVGEDWYFLFALGVIMAMISFMIDLIIFRLFEAHRWLYREIGDYAVLKYLSWTIYPVALAAFSTGFSQSITAHSGGSGIPELKTILTGVMLEDYLSIKNFGAKVVGLTCMLACGSTVFLGKVGACVHISAMLAVYLGKMRTSVTKEYEDKFKQNEMLVAAHAVGVATVFGAPISAVRVYWRGFFAATCGAFMFRLLAVFNSEQETIIALFKTNLKLDFPFDLRETFFFLALGVICGVVACAYLFCQRWLLGYVRVNKFTAKLLRTDKPVYTALVVLLLASITFPPSLGQFMASQLTMKEYLVSLFDNRTWGELGCDAPAGGPRHLWQEWCHPSVRQCWDVVRGAHPSPHRGSAPSTPYPSSAGAALGRLVGETVAALFPQGVTMGYPVVAGGYALAGAAAFSGAVTHSVSTALLVCEATGQLAWALPVTAVLATLTAATDAADFPVVESAETPTLVGTVSRTELVAFLQSHGDAGEKPAGTVGDDCTIEPIMLQLSPWTSLHQTHHLFELLKLQRLFVTRGGELVGAVTRAEVRMA